MGSGRNPHLRVDMLVESFVESTVLCSWRSETRDERQFVRAHVDYLPFRDGTFGYVIISHTAERAVNFLAAITFYLIVSQNELAPFLDPIK
jgi:hypothetical protein